MAATDRAVVRRRLPLLLALIAVAGLLIAPPAVGQVATVTFRPRPIAYSAPEIANVDRGQYRWQDQPAQPPGWPSNDVYYRDQVYWGRIEPTRGSYDFSQFDAGLAEAGAQHGKFSFRVMAWCPGCWMEGNPVGSAKPPATPPWMPRQTGASTDPPPAWNSSTFLTAWRQLMTQLGKRYDKDPRLGTVDIGGYGAYGEWHTDGVGDAITVANAKKVVAAVLDAFPHHKVLINTMIPSYVLPALRMSKRVGVRQDCLGAAGNGFNWTFDSYRLIRDRWRTAPVVTEWCHGAGTSIQRGAAQVSKYHVSTTSSGNTPTSYDAMSTSEQAAWRNAAKHAGYRYQIASVTAPRVWHDGQSSTVTLRLRNVGSAPTYDAWRVRLRLVRADGTVAATHTLPIDLRRLLPGIRTYTPSVRLTGVAPGTYRLALVVADPSSYAAPMALATQGRSSRGDYPLGTVRVG